MAELLSMHLLGPPELSLGGRPLSVRRRKALGLLAYLALTEQPAARATLGLLFAGESSEPLALQSLRVQLAELREHLAGHLILSRQMLAFNYDSPHWIDVHEFERLLGEAPADDLPALAAAIDLYRGDLLAGLAIPNALDFAAWLAGERQRLRYLALGALHKLLAAYARARNLTAGLAVAERILAMEPGDEACYRTAMGLLADCGDPEQALRFYERWRTVLGERRQGAPQPETNAVSMPIRDAAPATGRFPQDQTGSAAEMSPELALLVARLTAPECRLVTLLSPSPDTATALALRIVTFFLTPWQAPRPHPFPDGVYMTSPTEPPQGERAPAYTLAQLIWQVLAAAAGSTDNGSDNLVELLGASTMLLVIDGLVPTDEDVALVATILRRAPRVKLLVAARERLLLQEEWVLDVASAT